MFLDRRKPGQSKFSTPRQEGDKAIILSGTMDEVTTGCPISIMVENDNQRSRDYSNIANVYRPGHADYTYDEKFGIRVVAALGKRHVVRYLGLAAAVCTDYY